MNKLLVTGLALGKEADVCDACNFSFGWLLEYPSVFVWSDKILVPEVIWKAIMAEAYPPSKELAKCCKLIFEIAEADGTIEIVSPLTIIDDTLKKAIFDEIEKDAALLQKTFPDRVSTRLLGDSEDAPRELTIDGVGYCKARIWTIYASLILARALGANCLFEQEVLLYMRHKFGISGSPAQADSGKIESSRTIFEAVIPNDPIFPDYAFSSQRECLTCRREDSCKDTYLSTLEKSFTELIRWREYDEVQELRSTIEEIIRKRSAYNEPIDPQDIIHDFRDREKMLRNRLKSVFPKAKRWAHIATMLSIPIAVSGVVTGASLMTVAGAGSVGLSQLTKELINLLESKYRWISFLQTNAVPCRTEEE